MKISARPMFVLSSLKCEAVVCVGPSTNVPTAPHFSSNLCSVRKEATKIQKKITILILSTNRHTRALLYFCNLINFKGLSHLWETLLDIKGL